MIRHKICMLGAFAVGKTSLVRRFVHSIFSEQYQTTLGVQIEKRQVEVNERSIDLMLWDIAGEDDFFRVPESYLTGAAGYFLVVDGTRSSTIEVAVSLSERAVAKLGDVPSLVLANKADRTDAWDVADDLGFPTRPAGELIRTSALSGDGVARAFDLLAARIETSSGRGQ